MMASRLAGLVVTGALLVLAPPLRAQDPVVVHQDTITLAPVRVAVTAFARYGVLVEILGRSPRLAVFLPDSAGEAWRQHTFEQLTASGDDATPPRPVWSDETLPEGMRQAAGLWMGYAASDDRPGEAELQVLLYRPAFDVVTILPLTPAEAQRLLGRLGDAFAASHRGLEANRCVVPPAVRESGRFPAVTGDLRHPNGEIVMGFEIAPDGTADPASIVTLFTTERALESPARKLIARASYTPATGPTGPCRTRVVQPFMYLRDGPASWEAVRKVRITRTR